ncbi:MAG TPA: hypothetical protein VGE13_02920 [Candidatus Saccharimonadales bacterium]
MIKDNTLWILDFDRCLGDIDMLYERLQFLIESREILPIGRLDELRRQTEASGGSFDALGECRALLASDAYEELLDIYIYEPTNDEYLLPGGYEFLSWLNMTDRPFMIMTYGQEEWQLAKLKRTGLSDAACMVTPTSVKAGLIAKWQQADHFRIPRDKIMNSARLPDQVKNIILVDDKARAFIDAPTNLRGYWVQARTLLPSQEGTVPDSVKIVSSFQEIIQYESAS